LTALHGAWDGEVAAGAAAVAVVTVVAELMDAAAEVAVAVEATDGALVALSDCASAAAGQAIPPGPHRPNASRRVTMRRSFIQSAG
jgi:hypothetical protein